MSELRESINKWDAELEKVAWKRYLGAEKKTSRRVAAATEARRCFTELAWLLGKASSTINDEDSREFQSKIELVLRQLEATHTSSQPMEHEFDERPVRFLRNISGPADSLYHKESFSYAVGECVMLPHDFSDVWYKLGILEALPRREWHLLDAPIPQRAEKAADEHSDDPDTIKHNYSGQPTALPDETNNSVEEWRLAGYRSEISAWMKRKTLPNLEAAARKLGIGHSILKSIASDVTPTRCSREKLDMVLRKIRDMSNST